MILQTDAGEEDPLNAMDVVDAKSDEFERCNAFVGSKDDVAEQSDALYCHKCTGLVCRTCGDALSDTESKHECATPTEIQEDGAFEGLKLGQHWQTCGNCSWKIELSEACNEIACPCGQRFCYLCGASVVDQPAHFARGGCPRWGNGENATAEDFDEPVRVPGPHTTQEWNEAVRTAQEDETAHPTFPWQDEPLSNLDRNLRIIQDRNDVHSVVIELHHQLHLDNDEFVPWRQHTYLLLGTVQLGLNLLLSGSHAPAEEYPHYITAFEGYERVIEEKSPFVPLWYIDSQGYLFDVVPSVVAQMQLMTAEMRGEVEWGRFMIPF